MCVITRQPSVEGCTHPTVGQGELRRATSISAANVLKAMRISVICHARNAKFKTLHAAAERAAGLDCSSVDAGGTIAAELS